MKRIGRKWVVSIMALMLLCMVSAAAAEGFNYLEMAKETTEAWKENLSESVEANRPQVRTMENGVKVQRTPIGQDVGMYVYLADNMAFNTQWLGADRKGCAYCHADLAAVVENMEQYPHVPLDYGMGVDYTINQCIGCHSFGSTADTGSVMHALHDGSNKAFEAMGGDCMSCHYAGTYTNGLQLWDNVKHDVMRGITPMNAEAVKEEMTFSWDQDTVLGSSQIMAVNWYYMQGGVARYSAWKEGIVPDPATDGVYDQWTIEFSGAMDKPFSMTLTELIEKFGLVTTTMTQHCGLNTIGSSLVGNFEITGIPLKDVLEYAGIQDECTLIRSASGPEGYSQVVRPHDLANNEGYIVLEINGEPIPYTLGYPAQVMVGGVGAWSCVKSVTNIEALTVEPLEYPGYVFHFDYAHRDANGYSRTSPNVAMFYFKEGQIIEEGKPFTFEGYAHAWDIPIAGMEYSFDRGQTWVSFETENTNVRNWVYWRLTWEAPEAGAYTMMIRAKSADGYVTSDPLDYLVNVQ